MHNFFMRQIQKFGRQQSDRKCLGIQENPGI